MAEYRYHLATWAERLATRRRLGKDLACPGCGMKGCFKEYVDDNGDSVDPDNHSVGKCDHTTHCCYHRTPKEYFADGGKLPESPLPQRPRKDIIRIEIAPELVGQFHQRTVTHSNRFMCWVRSLPLTDQQREALPMLAAMYAIGTTRDGRIIWWQIDENRVVRTGKIMAYDDNGHRLKDADGKSIGFGWVHSQLSRQGMYLENDRRIYELQQCLFGQHLLPICPDAEVHIVESEKTAFLMSLLDPDAMSKHIWLATGGLFNLNVSKLHPMNGRTIYCYPDVNGIEKWSQAIKGTGARLATSWMSGLLPEDGEGADVADIIIRRMLTKTTPATEQTTTDRLEDNAMVQLLINRLHLTKQ